MAASLLRRTPRALRLRARARVARAPPRRGIHALTVNAGSTTLKYALYDVARRGGGSGLDATLLSSGLVDRVGAAGGGGGSHVHDGRILLARGDGAPVPSHAAAFGRVLDALGGAGAAAVVDAVGHRVVHGGATFSAPTVVDDAALAEIERLGALAPLHNPPAAEGIRAARAAFPDAAQVAVFDTAFHATMPPEAYRYALPRGLYEDHGLRR